MSLFTSLPDVVDAVICITMIEFAALALYRLGTGRGVAPGDIAANMTSGLFLMFALHCAVSEADAVWVGVWLLAAGLAHAVDIVCRWRVGSDHAHVAERSVA